MFKFLFEFSNGSNILISHDSKKKAIDTLFEKYEKLATSTDFTVKTICLELDKEGNIVEYH